MPVQCHISVYYKTMRVTQASNSCRQKVLIVVKGLFVQSLQALPVRISPEVWDLANKNELQPQAPQAHVATAPFN